MDLIAKLVTLAIEFIGLTTLVCFLPLYLPLKFFVSNIRAALFPENVAGKVILITGAASGIGENLAYEYGRRGALLALVDIREAPLRRVAVAAKKCGSPAVAAMYGDVSKVDDCKSFVDATVRHFGRLDHLVTNAGVAPLYMFEEVSDLAKPAPPMDINFWGSIYCTFHAHRYLKQSRGHIVVIASACGWLPSPRLSFYCASKAAVITVYETLRVEFGSDIKITIVNPGIINSEMTRGKFLSKEGELRVDQTMRDVISLVPVEPAETCAKAIVKAVCRGEKSLTEPRWVSVLLMWKVFWPEALERLSRWLIVTEPGVPLSQTPSKKMVDVVRAIKEWLSLS